MYVERRSGMGFAPAAAPVASAAGPIGWAVLGVASVLGAIFGFGGDPHADDLDNFSGDPVKSQLLSNARATGAPTYAAWYGHLWGVDAGGSFVTLGDYSTLTQAEQMLQRAADTTQKVLYALWYGVMRRFSPTPPAPAATPPPVVTTPPVVPVQPAPAPVVTATVPAIVQTAIKYFNALGQTWAGEDESYWQNPDGQWYRGTSAGVITAISAPPFQTDTNNLLLGAAILGGIFLLSKRR